MRLIAALCISSVMLVVGLAAVPNAAERNGTRPDFYENGVGWITRSNDFYPPRAGLGPVTFDPSHPYIMEGGAENRQQTFRVADIDHPALMPWVREALKQMNDQVLAGKPLYTVANSCRPAGVPNILLVRLTPFFFLQTPREVWLIWQNDHMVRRIYMDQQHSRALKPSWFGESVGHYEGDTLVVDTIGLNTRTTVDNYHTPHSDRLHVVERFHKVEGGKLLEVDVTVDDPGAFTRPWSAMQHYGRVDFTTRSTPEIGRLADDAERYLSEEICAETAVTPVNIGMPPVPRADKPDF